MKNFHRLGAGLAILLATAVTGCANEGEERQGGGGGASGASNQQPAAAAADRAFIDEMTPHHEMGVMMAEDALKKAKRPELRSFARTMMADQRREVAEMKAHRRHLFGSAETPPMEHGEMTHAAAGPDYDIAWAKSMDEHHQQAIETSREALSEAQAAETKAMARKMIEKQTKEQQQLRKWITAWSAK